MFELILFVRICNCVDMFDYFTRNTLELGFETLLLWKYYRVQENRSFSLNWLGWKRAQYSLSKTTKLIFAWFTSTRGVYQLWYWWVTHLWVHLGFVYPSCQSLKYFCRANESPFTIINHHQFDCYQGGILPELYLGMINLTEYLLEVYFPSLFIETFPVFKV